VDKHNLASGHVAALKALEFRGALRAELSRLREEIVTARGENDELARESERIAKGLPPVEHHRGASPRVVKCKNCGLDVSAANLARHVERERRRRKKERS